MRADEYGVITTTFPSQAEAGLVGDMLLAERLAACVQFFAIESRYVWQGETRRAPEVMLLAKTRAALFEAAIARIKALHLYEMPEIVAQPFAAGYAGYLDWIGASTGDWHREVLDFWFRELTPKDWFGGGAAVDEAIATRFVALYRSLKNAPPGPGDLDAAQHLAAILVFDQFPRNLFRHHADAFASDALALEMARHAIDRGLDKTLSPQERRFLYMPLMHSEDGEVQARSVRLFEEMGDADAAEYARAHRDVVARFGRFPGRNAALGRASTEAERVFLETVPQRF